MINKLVEVIYSQIFLTRFLGTFFSIYVLSAIFNQFFIPNYIPYSKITKIILEICETETRI